MRVDHVKEPECSRYWRRKYEKEKLWKSILVGVVVVQITIILVLMLAV